MGLNVGGSSGTSGVNNNPKPARIPTAGEPAVSIGGDSLNLTKAQGSDVKAEVKKMTDAQAETAKSVGKWAIIGGGLMTAGGYLASAAIAVSAPAWVAPALIGGGIVLAAWGAIKFGTGVAHSLDKMINKPLRDALDQ